MQALETFNIVHWWETWTKLIQTFLTGSLLHVKSNTLEKVQRLLHIYWYSIIILIMMYKVNRTLENHMVAHTMMNGTLHWLAVFRKSNWV